MIILYLIHSQTLTLLFGSGNKLQIILNYVTGFFDRGSFDPNSVDQNCVLLVDRNFHNQLTKFFESFQLIKKFDQLPKKN
jgi:hypothetical protein